MQMNFPSTNKSFKQSFKSNKMDACLISETHNTKHLFNKLRVYKFYYKTYPGLVANEGNAVRMQQNNINKLNSKRKIMRKQS